MLNCIRNVQIKLYFWGWRVFQKHSNIWVLIVLTVQRCTFCQSVLKQTLVLSLKWYTGIKFCSGQHVSIQSMCLFTSRHVKIHNDRTIGWWKKFNLKKEKGSSVIEFVESICLNFRNEHDHDCGHTSIDVSDQSKSA